jgi:sugar transferase (PEP-CTERM/EpsH1 system associated)
VDDLLFLSHRIPYPPDKGEKIRGWHFVQHLAGRYRVHLACLVDNPEDARHAPRLEQLCATVVWRPLVPVRARLRSLAGLAGGAPLTRGYFRDRHLQRAIDRLVAEFQPARALVFCSAMAPYVEHHRFPRCILDMGDVDSEKWRHYATATSGPLRILYAREARTMLALERRAARLADRTLFVSEAEADLFRRLAPEVAARVDHVGNGVDVGHFDPGERFSNPFAGTPAIVFLGTMDYRPNVDAVGWFASAVMPLLRSDSGRPAFWIVGANPSAAVRRLAQDDIRVTGRVDDVRPYLAHAAAVVAPLRIARGVQNKVLEAMAMAAPVILTPQARQGLGPGGRDELIEASTAPEFAERIRNVLRDPAAAKRCGARARERVRKDFGWPSSFAALDLALEPDRRSLAGPDENGLARDRLPVGAR